MEWIVYIVLSITAFIVGWVSEKLVSEELASKDDGIVIINEERVEVIFRDPYEKLIKKKYVNLKIES